MPSLGSDMERATLIEWLVQPGETVKRGDVIAVVETDKGAIEIEVFNTGSMGTLLVELGADVEVGAPLAEIVDGREKVGDVASLRTAVRTQPTPAASPPVTPSAPASMPEPRAMLRASPAARRLAENQNINLSTVTGSGPAGAVVIADVEAVLAAGDATTAEAPVPLKGADPMSGMRRAIAAAMTRSKREIPHYYLSHAIDVQPLVDWLKAENAARAPADRLLVGALYIRAVALALRQFGEFNGFYEQDGFHASPEIHVGTAIAIRGGGLVAPALHNTDTLSVNELMTKLKDLTKRVRAGRFKGSELRDPTVTVSSLGDRGVDALFGVIYPPQVACIGFGTLTLQPRAHPDGRVDVRTTVVVSLAGDHRVSDGRRGALLLRAIANLLQVPGKLCTTNPQTQ